MYSPEVTKALKQSDRQFKKFLGVTKPTFFQLLSILRVADAERHKFGRRPSRIFLETKLLWTLPYWREYRTMEHLAYEYNTVVSHIFTIKSFGSKMLLSKTALFVCKVNKSFKIPIRRIKRLRWNALKKQKDWYSGKKKQHTGVSKNHTLFNRLFGIKIFY
jgi:hypothetical protein